MAIVVGLDVHRSQITYDALNAATGDGRPWESPRRRPSDLPAGGRRISPLVAFGSPHDLVLIGRYSPARLVIDARGAGLKSSEEVMEILEAFDLTGTLRGAANGTAELERTPPSAPGSVASRAVRSLTSQNCLSRT